MGEKPVRDLTGYKGYVTPEQSVLDYDKTRNAEAEAADQLKEKLGKQKIETDS